MVLFGLALKAYFEHPTHKVGKEGNVVEAVEEVLGKTMTERMGVDHIFIQSVFFSKVLELLGYASCGNPLPETVEEDIARADMVSL